MGPAFLGPRSLETPFEINTPMICRRFSLGVRSKRVICILPIHYVYRVRFRRRRFPIQNCRNFSDLITCLVIFGPIFTAHLQKQLFAYL